MHDLPAIGSLIRFSPLYRGEFARSHYALVHRVRAHSHYDKVTVLCRDRAFWVGPGHVFHDVPEDALDCEVCKARVCRAALRFADDLHRVVWCPECHRRNVDLGADEWEKTHGHLGYACVIGANGYCILAEHQYRPCHYPPGSIIF